LGQIEKASCLGFAATDFEAARFGTAVEPSRALGAVVERYEMPVRLGTGFIALVVAQNAS
jgi:hypothetical protein